MRAWETEWYCGINGSQIAPEQVALVVQAWQLYEGMIRMLVLCNNRIVMFSCHTKHVSNNWHVTRWEAASGSL